MTVLGKSSAILFPYTSMNMFAVRDSRSESPKSNTDNRLEALQIYTCILTPCTLRQNNSVNGIAPKTLHLFPYSPPWVRTNLEKYSLIKTTPFSLNSSGSLTSERRIKGGDFYQTEENIYEEKCIIYIGFIETFVTWLELLWIVEMVNRGGQSNLTFIYQCMNWFENQLYIRILSLSDIRFNHSFLWSIRLFKVRNIFRISLFKLQSDVNVVFTLELFCQAFVS